MSYRLAIAISGAVSLGSYEAGVMFEVIRAIGQHNENVSADEQILIDVITGASAGGMTAALTAQKLLYDRKALEDPKGNHLYQPWVQDIDIEKLLNWSGKDDVTKHLLSSDLVAGIAEKYLLARFKQAENPIDPHPAAAKEIELGMAISNLNGMDYAIPVFNTDDPENPTSHFKHTRFQDRFLRKVNGECNNKEYWMEVAVAAMASGAFPFAFSPQDVLRTMKERPYNNEKNLVAFEDKEFVYTDGGVFDNSPLGMAKELAERIDTDALDYEKRFYLYISPAQKASGENSSLNRKSASFVNMGKALIGAIFKQGRFQDWVTMSQTNQLILQFDSRVYRLREAMKGFSADEVKALDGIADKLLDRIFEKENVDDRVAGFERLKKQFIEEKNAEQRNATDDLSKKHGEMGVNAWIKAAQVLERSGRLHNKDQMIVYTVTADEEMLAGKDIGWFGGFFEQRFREFDYHLGRTKAREELKKWHAAVKSDPDYPGIPLTILNLTNDLNPLDDADKDLNSKGIEGIYFEKRKKLYKLLSNRINRIMKENGIKWFIRIALNSGVIKGKIKKFLALEGSIWLRDASGDAEDIEDEDYV